jgi:putative SOS response-associated peptidase YedK
MCGRINIDKKIYYPGQRFYYNTHKGVVVGTWGIGQAYNARIENIATTWNKIQDNRGLLSVNGFYEKEEFVQPFYECHKLSSNKLLLATLYDDDNNFVIITRPAQSSMMKIHHRMPLLIDDGDKWLEHGIMDYTKEFNLAV